jgi:magnesium transporter
VRDEVGMLSIFRRGRRGLEPVDTAAVEALPEDAVWIDMLEPTPEEVRFATRALGTELPTREEMREIEASARVYEEGEGLFLTATLVLNADAPSPATTEVTFILVGDRLATLRYAAPQPFRALGPRLERHGPGLANGVAAFFWLLDGVVARLADVLERTTADLDGLSSRIFNAARLGKGEERPDMIEAIERIGRAGETASKARESLHTLERVLLAVGLTDRLPAHARKEARARAKALNRDVRSLTEHAGFLSQKVNLTLDATLGLINIEQNAIIKIFSVVAVIFLPPTLVASVYGMNFQVMPELSWRLGYPFAVVLMVLSAIVPFLYFKRRGWL